MNMKNTIRKIALLSLTLFLASCNQNVESNSATNKESTADTSKTESSKESTAATEPEKKSDIVTLSWSESDLKAMSKYLNGYTSLPFPTGFTSTYVEASGTDSDGECFIAYDSNSGDLCSSYGKQLLDCDFTYDEEGSEDGYYYYYLTFEDATDEIWVQVDYYQNDFEIFAWVETGIDTSATFPYSTIDTFLSMSNVDESIVPSFELAEGMEYEIYVGEGYLIIGGEYDTTIDEETYLNDYMTKLTNAGYTLDTANYYASNETYSIGMYYGVSDGYFSIQPFAI